MSRLVRILISVGLLALIVVFVDWRAIWEVLRRISIYWLGVVLILTLCDRLVINYRWQVLLAGRGVTVPFVRLFRVQLAANFYGSFLPGFIGVDGMRIAALCRSGEPTAPVIAATLVDRATLAVATLIVGAVTVTVMAQARVPENIVQFVFAAAAVALLSMAVCLYPPVRRWVRLALLPYAPERLRRTVTDVVNAALAYRREWWTIMLVVGLTALIFALRILFAKAVACACGIDIPFIDLLLVIPMLWIIVMIPITIGGIGVQEAGYVVLMGLIGISAPVAVSMSLVEHVIVRLAILPGAFFLREFSKVQPKSMANAANAPS